MNASPLVPGRPAFAACLEPVPAGPGCTTCPVREQALFSVLQPAERERVRDQVVHLAFAPDDALYLRAAPAGDVFTIRAGVVRFERPTTQGTRRIVRLAGPGDLIGAEALLDLPYADEAIACTAVEACRIPKAAIDELTRGSERLTHELMRRWQLALEASETWLTELATGSAMRRLLGLLDRLQHYAGADGQIWMPRRDQIGLMLDMTIETASRQISQLRREGVLELRGQRHARLDTQALAAALQRHTAN